MKEDSPCFQSTIVIGAAQLRTSTKKWCACCSSSAKLGQPQRRSRGIRPALARRIASHCYGFVIERSHDHRREWGRMDTPPLPPSPRHGQARFEAMKRPGRARPVVGIGGDAGELNSRSSEGQLRIVLQAFPPIRVSPLRCSGGPHAHRPADKSFAESIGVVPRHPGFSDASSRRCQAGLQVRRLHRVLSCESELAIVAICFWPPDLRG